MLDSSSERFLRILSAGGGNASSVEAATRRDSFKTLLGLAGAAETAPIVVEDRVVDALSVRVPVRSYRPLRLAGSSGPLPTCVFFHGGGFVAGSIETHDNICRSLSHASGWQLVSVGYRLAPEHPYPAPIEDGLAVVGAIMMQPADYRADPDCIAVAGDSVGAGLAVRICRIVNERVAMRVKLQVLLCPAFDATPRFASRTTFAHGYSIDADMIAADFNSFRGRLASVASPLDDGGFADLPPAIVHVAECDPFRDEGLAFAQKLRSARVPVDATTHAGMLHIFHAFSRFIPQGRAVLQQVGAQLKQFGATRSLATRVDESAVIADAHG